jgi:16S rRNA (uracil1498-N3)-methyltransferase
VREAAEQSRRGKLPRLAPALFFPAACEQAARRSQALLLWEGAGVSALRRVLRELGSSTAAGELKFEGRPSSIRDPRSSAHTFSIALFSGPEGGFSVGEFETASRYGIIPVTLGPRTLRAETAPLVAASAILYEMGDLE